MDFEKFLNNELVQKYFGCEPDFRHLCSPQCAAYSTYAYRILKSMFGPIKPGECYIFFGGSESELYEYANKNKSDITGFHWNCLKLPQRFQPEKRTLAKEKISEILSKARTETELEIRGLRALLEELVALARTERED